MSQKTLVSFTDVPKMQTVTLLKSRKTEVFETILSIYQEESPTLKVEYWVLENNGAENRCKRSTPSRKCLTFCEKRLPVAEWAHMRLQKSPAKAKAYATIFAKIWQ